jgi:hypothetical protein
VLSVGSTFLSNRKLKMVKSLNEVVFNMIFWRKKKSEITPALTEDQNILEQICGDDTALYGNLSDCLYLHPVGKLTYEDAMKKAETLEKDGKIQDACRSYWHDAGASALYEGNVEGVKKAFGKHRELSGRSSRITEVPEKAVEKAREFYDRTLKPEVTKK